MGRTRTQLRQGVAKQLMLPFASGTADSGGSTTTLKDLPNLARFANDDLIGAYIYLSSGSPTFAHLRITDNVGSTGIATFIPAIGAAPDTLTYEVLPFPADSIHDAIDDALKMLYDTGWLGRPFIVKAVTGSPILNGFPVRSSLTAIQGWDNSGLTLAALSGDSFTVNPESSVSLDGTGTLTPSPEWASFYQDLAPGTVSVYALLYSNTASALGIRIIDSESNASAITYHPGDSQWKVVKIENHALDDTATLWRPRIMVDIDANANNRFGGLWVTGSASLDLHPFPLDYMPDGPSEIIISDSGLDVTNTRAHFSMVRGRKVEGWEWIVQRNQAGAITTSAIQDYGLLRWQRAPAPGRVMWLIGNGPLSLPTADAQEVELNQYDALLVEKVAAVKLLQREVMKMNSSAARNVAATIRALEQDIAGLIGGADNAREAAGLGPHW